MLLLFFFFFFKLKMNSTVNKLLFLLSFLFSISYSSSDELSILLKLKSAFQESNPPVFDTWKSNISPCNFTGVHCNSKLSVTEIDLPMENLVGSLPIDSICQLPSLEKLNFASNYLFSISEAFKNCTNLNYLDISNNSFSGVVPDLSPLANMSFLNLNGSGFSGVFPWKSLANLPNLKFLSLGDNSFETSSFPMEVLKLDKLYWLYLTACNLEGKIPPEIGNLTELINLELSDNKLSGPIPAEIKNLKKLWQLELYNNFLTGPIPVGFGKLTNLQYFDASSNNLEGDFSELKFLTQLVTLSLYENKFFGEIPEEFGEFKLLVGLSLYSNKLTGSLPQSLGSWAQIDLIDVSENYLTGPIPPDMCKQRKMTVLLLLQNNFSGGIPESYAKCLSMTRFRVSNNSLSGNVPGGLWGLPGLDILDLAMNQFNGSVSREIRNAKYLTQLRLSNNRFSGEVPSEITKASRLGTIDVSSNQFSGIIPTSIGELKVLNTLNLQKNMFHGSIPQSLGSCSFMREINFAGNLLTGGIPASLGSLLWLGSLDLSDNQLSDRIPASLSIPGLRLLDLSNNRLSGPIPKSLSNYIDNGTFAGNPELCSPTIQYFRPCSSDSGSVSTSLSLWPIIGAVIGLILGILFIIYICKRSGFSLHKRMSLCMITIRNPTNVEVFLENYGCVALQRYTYADVKKMTNFFKDTLGEGGYGSVFKGSLPDGRLVAVKVLKESKGNGEEFINEVATMGRTNHVNVVSLLGFCSNRSKRALIYEFMSNGSLERVIYNNNCSSTTNEHLGWNKLYQITLGIARGLEYLHQGCNTRILHFDIKPHNILLDEEFRPKISDFGLAKLCLTRESVVSMLAARGTIGYIAPEVYCRNFGGVSYKSDVYSYGMMVLEMVGGRKNIDATVVNTSEIYFPHWIYNHLEKDIAAGGYEEIFKDETRKKMMLVGLWCIQTHPTNRPSMTKVVEMLEGNIEDVDMPPNPFLDPPPPPPPLFVDCPPTSSPTTS